MKPCPRITGRSPLAGDAFDLDLFRNAIQSKCIARKRALTTKGSPFFGTTGGSRFLGTTVSIGLAWNGVL